MKVNIAYTLRAIVIGLTLISVTAGFEFYAALFGVVTAILCCLIFETLRLGCIWSLLLGWKSRIAVMPLYILIAGTCFLAALTSFQARIIESQEEAMQPIREVRGENLIRIKSAIASHGSGQLSELDSKIDVCQRKLAWNPQSHYWQNRLGHLTTQHQHLVASRDSLLSILPQDIDDEWLASQAALFDVTLESLPAQTGSAVATTRAIRELWGVTETQAKRMVSLIIAISVECAIVLLSLLSIGDRKVTTKKKPQGGGILQRLRQEYSDTRIRQFLEKNQASLATHGRPPLVSELGRAQRKMRQVMRGSKLNEAVIQEMLEKMGNSQE